MGTGGIQEWIKSHIFHIILVAAASFLFLYDIRNIFNFPGYSGSLGANGADEGVFLMTARLVASGSKMYSEINTHQGPLFSFILVQLNGDVFTSRIMTAILGSLGVILVMAITGRLSDRKASLVSGMLLAFNFLYFKESRHVSFDLYSTVMLLAAMVPLLVYIGYLKNMGRSKDRTRPVALMMAAGILLSFSAMSKLFAVVPVFFVGGFLLLIWFRKFRAKSFGRPVLIHISILVAATFFTTIILLSIFGLQSTLDGMFFDTLDRPSMDPMDKVVTVLYVLGTMSLPILLSICALKNRRSDPRIQALFLWAAPLLIFIIIQSTVWDHYFVLILPPFAILGGVGFSEFLGNLRSDGSNGPTIKKNKRILKNLSLVVVVVFLTISGGLNVFMLLSTEENIEHRIADDIGEITAAEDLVISGDPLIPLIADRDQPPGATNLAQLRSPELTDGDLVNITAEEDVKVVIICYNLVNYEDFVQLIIENFDFYRAYQRPGRITDVEGEVEIHLNTFNVYIRPDGMNGTELKDIYFDG